MKVLVACEESQRVCIAFRERGHEAYSCDVKECSGRHAEWHIVQDVLPLINGRCKFKTMDGMLHEIVEKWDLLIAHPPCTYLSSVATRHHSIRCTPLNKINQRTSKRIEAMQFFMRFANAECDRICIENPKGVMNTCYRKPDQIVDPYMFAESIEDTENYVTKATCFWLKNLPVLVENSLPKPNNEKMYGKSPNGKVKCWQECCTGKDGIDRATVRSKTFSGIAKAMAEQWG